VTVNLNRPPIVTGQISAADVTKARQHSTGNVWLMPRRATVAGRDTCNGQCETRAGCDCTPLLPHGCDSQGRHETRRFGQQAEFVDTIPTDFGAIDDGAAVEGGKHRDPVESMLQHRRVSASIKYGLALAALLAVAGFLAHLAWPQLG
jgi:hypothetical protein